MSPEPTFQLPTGKVTWQQLDGPGTPDRSAIITGTGKKRLTMLAGAPAPCGSPVRIDKDESVILGEVVFCGAESGGWSVLVEIDQVIPSVPDLARLMYAIGGGSVRPECVPEIPPVRAASR